MERNLWVHTETTKASYDGSYIDLMFRNLCCRSFTCFCCVSRYTLEVPGGCWLQGSKGQKVTYMKT